MNTEKEIAEIVYGVAIHAIRAEASSAIEPKEAINRLNKLISTPNQLLDELEKRVIGEDEYMHPQHFGSSKWYEVQRCNELRAKQRTIIAEMREEL